MTTIPTALEFLNRDESGVFNEVDITQAMIGFAKLHVEAALQAGSENSQITLGEGWIRKEETILPNQVVYPITIKVEQNSILDAYPISMIK
jgi:hypothetical protein